ncbi:MAG: DUF4340 domain-containing protein [Deltaproteobacteria bacterium]|nr:DUF4340 domain-containing protein [Deltaproteobacteria bacterium]
MRYTTTIVLLVAAAGLAAYVYFVERHSRTTAQVEADRVKLLPGFDRDAVSRIVISRPGQPEVVLEREKKGEWKLTAPKAGGADAAVLSEILSAVEFLEYRARVGDVGARSRAEYGLQPPKATIRLRAGPKELVLSVGNDDAAGQGVYAARGDEPAVYVVEKRFRELLDRDPDALRDRRLLAFDPGKVKQLRVGDTVLTREGSAWFLTTPQKMRAAEAKVQELLRALETARATRFVPDATPVGKVVSVTDDGVHTVTVGGDCPGAAGEVLAVRGVPEAASLCVAKADADRVTPPRDVLRDTRLLTVRPEDARKVVIAALGRELGLARDGAVWKVTAPAGAAADDEVVRKWLEDLGSYRALAVAPGDPAARGLGGKDTIKVTVEQEGGGTTTVAIGASRDGRRWARRGDEAVLLQVHAEAGDAISADPLFFRSRKVLQVARWEVRTITVAAGGTTEVAERGPQEQWRLEKPLALDADAGVIDRLLAAVVDLRAEKLLAGAAAFAPTHTLRLATQPTDADAAQRDGGVRKVTTHVLEIGADAPGGGGCLARSTGTVMVLAKAACEDLRVRLATRKLVDIGEQSVVGLTLARGGKSEVLEKRGPTWHKAAGPRVPTEQIDDLLGALRGLSARAVVQYGPDVGHGLAKPRLEASLRLDGGKEIKLTFGAESERGVFARLQGRDVTYLVARRDVETFEKAAP